MDKIHHIYDSAFKRILTLIREYRRVAEANYE